MHRPVLLSLILAAVVLGSTAGAATRTIVIRASGLSDKDITITQGDTVTWRNDDTANHQIVSVSGVFSSPVLRTGGKYSYTFNNAGTFRYHDALDNRDRFKGVVRVRLAPSVSLTASLPQVVYGTKITLNGQINTKASGQQVQILYQPFGQPSPIVLATVVTGTDGVFGFEAKPTILTSYQAKWGNVTSASTSVQVAPRVTLGRSGRWVSCVFAARSMAGKKVLVQRHTRFGDWVSIKAVKLGARSCAHFRLRLPKGVYRLRVKMSINQAGAGYLAGLSREVTWRHT